MPETRVIPSDTHQLIRTLLQKAQEHRLEAEALEQYAKQLIVTTARIDLDDENWQFDLERGLVTRQDKENADQSLPTPSVARQPTRRNRKRHQPPGHGDEGDAGTD